MDGYELAFSRRRIQSNRSALPDSQKETDSSLKSKFLLSNHIFYSTFVTSLYIIKLIQSTQLPL